MRMGETGVHSGVMSRFSKVQTTRDDLRGHGIFRTEDGRRVGPERQAQAPCGHRHAFRTVRTPDRTEATGPSAPD